MATGIALSVTGAPEGNRDIIKLQFRPERGREGRRRKGKGEGGKEGGEGEREGGRERG